jgi:threonine synthase
MPRVVHLAEQYNRLSGGQRVFVVQVSEQAIMDWELLANRNGHIACTHGGESLAGLVSARALGIIDKGDVAVIDSTAHALKFSGFTDMYFKGEFPPEYNITADPTLSNRPQLVRPEDLDAVPGPGAPLVGDAFERFVRRTAEEIAAALKLEQK